VSETGGNRNCLIVKNALLGDNDMPDINNQPKFWPSSLTLELTTRCNLRCIMCAINQDPRIQKGGKWYGDLSLEAFDNLSKVVSKIIRIDLSGHGESLLSPHFLPILEKVKQHGAYVGLTTNASLMGKGIAESIVRNQMDEIIISIHAATPESYARISRNGKFEMTVANIKTLNSLKKQYNTVLPVVKFNFVGMKSNIGELNNIINLAAGLNVEAINVLPLAEYETVKGETLDPSDLAAYIPNSLKTAKECGVNLFVPKVYLDQISAVQNVPSNKILLKQRIKSLVNYWLPKKKPHENSSQLVRDCLDPWDFFFVMQSGRIRPCCIIEENMGNLSKQEFEAIWFGDKYQKLRSDILKDTPLILCKTCINRPFTTLMTLRAKVHEKITRSV